MKYNNLLKVLAFILLTIVVVSLFWRNYALLLSLLILMAYIKHKILPIKKEINIYIIGGLLGTFGESAIMASGAWGYSIKTILNFPLWLPFLWGLAGILGISIYQEISKGGK